MPEDVTARFEASALEYQTEFEDVHTTILKKILEDLKEATTIKEKYLVQAADQPLEFSACVRSQDTLERWHGFFDTYTHSWSALQDIRRRSMTPPVPPDSDEVQRLEELPWDAVKEPIARPEWLTPVSHLREEQFPFWSPTH